MPGPGFSWVFGGSAVQPANTSYLALALTANTTLVWPPQAPTGSTVFARIMDVTPSGAGLSLTMPPANQTSAGMDTLVTNLGSSSFTIYNNAGGVLAVVAPGQQYYLYIQNPTTAAGVWNAVLFAASSSNLTASAIVGTGTIAIGSTLSPNFVTSVSSASPLTLSATSDRSAQYVWTGGVGIINLPALSAIPSPKGYFVILNNKGTGTVTVTPNGSDTVDGNSTEALNPGYAAIYFAGPGGWYSFGFLSSTKFNFTELVQTVTGGTLTLTQTQAANVVQKYQGTLTSNQTVVMPPIVQVYYVQNATSGSFALTFNCGAGTSVSVPQGQNAILFADGTNMVNASTTVSGISSLLLGAGSAASPSIGFTADPSTGIYQPATGQLGITVSGNQVARFGALGSTPLTILAGTTSTGQISIYGNHATASGNAFIGFVDTNGSPTSWFLGSGVGTALASFGLYSSTTGANVITITAQGSVTIAQPTGTGTALTLSGVGTANYPLVIVGNPTSTPGLGSSVYMQGYQAAYSVMNEAQTQNWYFGVNDASSNSLWIGRGYGAAQGIAPSMTISTNGNIVAATPSAGTSPTFSVQVAVGGAVSQAIYTGTGNSALDIVGSSNSNNPMQIRFFNNAYATLYGEIYCDATGFTFGSQIATATAINTNGVNRVLVGSVGGMTINAPSSAAIGLTVNGIAGSTGLQVVGSAVTPTVAITYGTTITMDCTLSNNFRMVFGTGNVTTFTVNNPQDGQTINFRIKQDSIGSRTIAWPASFHWVLGAAPILSTAPNAEDMYVGQYNSTDATWVGSLMKGVQ